MAIRLFLVPAEQITTPLVARGPKYFRWRFDPDPPGVAVGDNAFFDFGADDTFLVACDVTAAELSALQALSDVTVIPANLDNQLGANLATVQAELEALGLPADQLTATRTYRQVLRGVVAIFTVAQRFQYLDASDGRLFPPGITLNTTVGSLSQATRDTISQAVNDAGYTLTGVTGATTLRQVLNQLASQPSPIVLLGMTI